MKKNVALLIDSKVVPKQIYDLIKLSMSAKNYQITTLIINDLNGRDNLLNKIIKNINYGLYHLVSKVFFKLICFLESIIVRKIPRFKNFYKKFDLHEFDLSTVIVTPKISKNGLVYRYSSSDIDSIRKLNFDCIIRAGSGILKGEILNLCPNGIISFHHADNNINRGGPPAFWEVYNKVSRTGFVIQRLNNELDGGEILYKGFISTNWIYSLILARIYESSNPFFHDVLENLSFFSSSTVFKKKVPYSYQIFKTPTFIQSANYLLKTGINFLVRLVNKILNKKNKWHIAYQFVDNWNDVTLWKSKKIQNPKNHFLADPFIIKKNSKHYCFLEKYSYSKKRGCISVYEITNDKCLDLGTAIEDNFHFSYPFLFEYESELYMCPETSEKREIRLYQCKNFPLEWKYHSTIMSDISAADTNIFFYRDRWWLFTNIDRSLIGDHSSQLYIFFSSNPLSNQWTPHSNNPVIFDSFKARNGGLILDKTDIYRVGQKQGFANYGESLSLYKIEILDTDKYQEKKLFNVKAKFFPKLKGVHTYNFSKGMLAFDYCKKN